MPHWLAKSLCLIVALGVLDGHLMLAQTWAWVGMVQKRAIEQGVSEALDSTFSGDAPCEMCCAIQKERQKKDEKAPVRELEPTAKFPPSMLGRTLLPAFCASRHIGTPVYPEHRVPMRNDSPPSPPPQGAS